MCLFRTSFISCFLLGLFGLGLGAQEEFPNVILFMVDDQGWTGTSVQMDKGDPLSKSDFYLTPNLEQLSENGMRFSRAYSASPVCSPTRASILTGLNPARLQMTDILDREPEVEQKLLCPSPDYTLDNEIVMLPEAIKAIPSANYLTGSFGKWHISEDVPENYGYDFSDGPTGNGSGNNNPDEDPKRIYSTTENAIDFMQHAVSEDKPFFMALNHYAVHLSADYDEQFYPTGEKGINHNSRSYAAMTQTLDYALGLIVEELDALGIEENTYIIYTSDNGAVEHHFQYNISNSVPLQKGKTFLWEGGIRVPFIVAGPGIEMDSQNDQPVYSADLYPTIIDLCNQSSAAEAEEKDARSIASELSGDEASENERSIVFHFPHYAPIKGGYPQSAIIKGDYKLLADYYTGQRFLFNLANDYSETNDLIDSEPALAQELYLELRDYLMAVNAQMPTLNGEYMRYGGSVPDLDEDGLYDLWEMSKFLHCKYVGEDDPDEDGFDNFEEFLAGSDPLKFDELLTSNHLLDMDECLRIFQNGSNLNIHTFDNLQRLEIVYVNGQIIQRRNNLSALLDLTFSTAEIPAGLILLRYWGSDGSMKVKKIRI